MSVLNKIKNAKRVQDVKKHYRLIALSGLSFVLTFIFTMVFRFTAKPKKAESKRTKMVKETYSIALQNVKKMFK